MSELFLIAHRCRGEATFDVAERMSCPNCGGLDALYEAMYANSCNECDGFGFWWILSTCGYRAYPWWSVKLDELTWIEAGDTYYVYHSPGPMPEASLDCFPINSPSHKSLPDRSNDLLARLNLIPKGPSLRRLR